MFYPAKITGISAFNFARKLEKAGYTEDCPSEFKHHFHKVTPTHVRFVDICYRSGGISAHTLKRHF